MRRDGAVTEFGHLDIIYNNAGIAGANGPIESISGQDWDRTMAVVLKSVFLCMKYAVPEMRKRGGGLEPRTRLFSTATLPAVLRPLKR